MDNSSFPYKTYSSYLKKKYGKPAYRVGVDGGFTCPNRNRDGSGGCAYCDETGAVAAYQRQGESSIAGTPFRGCSAAIPESCAYSRLSSLEERKDSVRKQILHARRFLEKRYRSEVFLLYFQAFSSTFGPLSELEEIYTDALQVMDFRELIVSTRPDCISPANARLLASYKNRVEDVWVELGLQSASDSTLSRISRGHTADQFTTAFKLLKEQGVKLSVHVILGLPGEGYTDIARTAELLAKLHPEAVKLHNLHLPIRTRMFDEYLQGEFTIPSAERHLSYAVHILERIPDDIIIQRLVTDTPGHRLAAPRNFMAKRDFIDNLSKNMISIDTWQGKYFQEAVSEPK
jgi:uncharacterized protein